MFYHDFKDTFVCNTQLKLGVANGIVGCFIMISKIHLYAIHNVHCTLLFIEVLFYHDFKDTFVCNTQPRSSSGQKTTRCFIWISKIHLYAIHNHRGDWRTRLVVVLSGFQRYFWMQYTTSSSSPPAPTPSFYQDFKDTFVCNTQHMGMNK